MTRRPSRTTPRNVVIIRHPCAGLAPNPQLGIQLGGFDPDPPCAPPRRRGSSGVGSEEPKTRGFRVPTRGEFRLFSSFQSCPLLLAASTFVETPPPICSLLPRTPCCILFYHLRPSLQSFRCSVDTASSVIFQTPPKGCLALKRPFLVLPSFSFLSSFIIAVKRLTILSLHCFHHLLLLYFTFYLSSFCFS